MTSAPSSRLSHTDVISELQTGFQTGFISTRARKYGNDRPGTAQYPWRAEVTRSRFVAAVWSGRGQDGVCRQSPVKRQFVENVEKGQI